MTNRLGATGMIQVEGTAIPVKKIDSEQDPYANAPTSKEEELH